ncbi:hypothetical protein EJB05_10190 [Eragrostis curvula]|uniref:Uncharacterized protein n=1 Tax=Eragrostis curvula TaxID=38414 RepID=A0A5J9W4L1_9POAL|nr:hypothetical protein EJB05_10190 [Eragrostis curvula]
MAWPVPHKPATFLRYYWWHSGSVQDSLCQATCKLKCDTKGSYYPVGPEEQPDLWGNEATDFNAVRLKPSSPRSLGLRWGSAKGDQKNRIG